MQTGQLQPRSRWKDVLKTEGDLLIEPLAKLFIKEYFTDKMKHRYTALVESIREAFKERIQNLEWMSDSTKRKALKKLTKLKSFIGYPDKWKDFSKMKIKRDAYVLNIMRANQWWKQHEMNSLKKPVDRSEWILTHDLRSASYNPSRNAIFLEAGSFIAPGRIDEELDDAFVYGYTFIGHEISHGFDINGKNFDADGNKMNWWTNKDSAEFSERADRMVRQYNEFVPLDTLHVDGQRTLKENIADLTGLLICLDAFKKTEQYRKNEKIDGFTPLQRFFLAYAYRQMGHRNNTALARQLERDSHAPDKERVNGVLMNVSEFYEAFGIKPGDKMYRPENLRVKIW
jgi:putative endopeptidase